MKFAQCRLLKPWVKLDLVHNREDAGLIEERLEVLDIEVAYADRLGASLVTQLNHGFPGFDVLVYLGYGPVNQVQVDVVELQLIEAGFECSAGWVVAVIAIP